MLSMGMGRDWGEAHMDRLVSQDGVWAFSTKTGVKLEA